MSKGRKRKHDGKTLKVLTDQERFHIASSVNGKTLKKSIAKRHDAPCFSLKFYRLTTTPKPNAFGLSRP